jgi:hypothetical protein
MGSLAMMYMPSFVKSGSGIEKFTGEDTQIYKHTDSKVISQASK